MVGPQQVGEALDRVIGVIPPGGGRGKWAIPFGSENRLISDNTEKLEFYHLCPASRQMKGKHG